MQTPKETQKSEGVHTVLFSWVHEGHHNDPAIYLSTIEKFQNGLQNQSVII